MTKRGRKKGSTSFVDLTYAQLGQFVGRKGIVKVSKVWLESVGGSDAEMDDSDLNTETSSPPISYKLTTYDNDEPQTITHER